MSAEHMAVEVVAGVGVITAVSAVCTAAARRLGQPAVIGQITAGILLGPTLLGRLPGHLDTALFPTEARPSLTVVAQLGLVLFMFSIGYELDLRLLRGRLSTVLTVSTGALLLPMALGTAVALGLRGGPLGSAAGHPVAAGPFLLFMAVATSITAVPVLAGVIRERGMTVTVPGAVAMASAALMDVIGWLVLAVAVAVVGGARQDALPVPVITLLVLGYVVVVLVVVRPALARWRRRGWAVGTGRLPVVVALAMASAWVTGRLGLHVIFGAFLLGLVMPREGDGGADLELLHPIERVSDLLMPVFFIVTGLSVDVGALRPADLLVGAGICAVAIAGKVGGGLLASRAAGLRWRESAVIGALLNTRGLTELIALDVGRQAGLIGGRLYTVLVLMALVTTAMTGPLLSALGASELVASAVRERVRAGSSAAQDRH